MCVKKDKVFIDRPFVMNALRVIMRYGKYEREDLIP